MKNRKGFTIVELVIVIAVIAILAAVLIPTFSGVIQKANDSAALQEATSTMKSALAMSKSGTLADNTLFVVGDNSGINYSYIYSGNSIGVDGNNTITNHKYATALTKGETYNSIILNDKLAQAINGADATKVKAIIKAALGIEGEGDLTLTSVSSAGETGVASGASYKLVNGEDIWSIFVNSDFAKDVVVFTYAN